MNILLMTLNTSLHTAGSNQMLSLAKYLISEGESVSCAYQFSREKYAATVRSFRDFSLHQFIYGNSEFNDEFKLFLKKGQYDIIHAHNQVAGFALRYIEGMVPIPRVVVGVGNSAPVSRAMLSVFTDQRTRSILAVSQQIAAQITEACDDDCGRKIGIICSGTNLRRFLPMPKNRKIAHEFCLDDCFVVGLLAHARWYKRIDVFLRASMLVRQLMPKVRFLIVGKVRAQDILDAENILGGLALRRNGSYFFDNVVFTDLRTDIPEVLSTFDVSINCSDHYEGISGAVRESLAMQIPTICTNIGGNAELIEDGKSGYLIPPGDEEALAERIFFVAENYAIAKTTAEEGCARVRRDFSARHRNQKIYRLYKHLDTLIEH